MRPRGLSIDKYQKTSGTSTRPTIPMLWEIKVAPGAQVKCREFQIVMNGKSLLT